MYQFTSILFVFALCVSCIQSAPPSELLAALLSPPSASAPSSYDADAVKPSEPSHNEHRETGLTTYDQKQSGKYNIHLSIKDVAIIALDAGGVDGVGDSGQDYYEDYDLSDFTVKPVVGLIEITSNSSTSPNATEPLPLIEFDVANATTSEIDAGNAMLDDPAYEPVKHQQQSLEILNQNDSEPANALPSSTITVVPSPSPAAPTIESSPSSISHKQTPLPIQYPIRPNEIPVQVILDPSSIPLLKSQLGRQRVNANGAVNANWRLRNRTTPSQHQRRITPPHSGFEDSPHFAASASSAFGNNKYRKNSLSHAQRRNCIVDQSGQCQNSQRRFSSPTL